MADDITLGELGRRLSDIAGAVNHLIGRAEYEAHRAALDRQLIDLSGDVRQVAGIVDALSQRVNDRFRETEKGVDQRFQSLEAQRSQVRLALVVAFVAPVVVGVFMLFLGSQGLGGGGPT